MVIFESKNQISSRFDKVGWVFRIVIWSEFRMGQYRDSDHWEHAHHFINWKHILELLKIRILRIRPNRVMSDVSILSDRLLINFIDQFLCGCDLNRFIDN